MLPPVGAKSEYQIPFVISPLQSALASFRSNYVGFYRPTSSAVELVTTDLQFVPTGLAYCCRKTMHDGAAAIDHGQRNQGIESNSTSNEFLLSLDATSHRLFLLAQFLFFPFLILHLLLHLSASIYIPYRTFSANIYTAPIALTLLCERVYHLHYLFDLSAFTHCTWVHLCWPEQQSALQQSHRPFPRSFTIPAKSETRISPLPLKMSVSREPMICDSDRGIATLLLLLLIFIPDQRKHRASPLRTCDQEECQGSRN